ncbi:MAG: type-F conjugative transfer system pilin assembly protein TrbC [Nitrospinae bacterium]|nr:type-F conjugative transfer system pilin assembly protein TrbC [Nitrospinota bacterium]
MGRHQIHTTTTIALLVCSFLLAAWNTPVLAQEKGEKAAREIVDHVLRQGKKSPPADLGSWSRSVLERALEQAGKNAPKSPSSLPAENLAGSLAENLSAPPKGSEIIVFMSLSIPASVWREWSAEAARIGAPLVLRGVAREGLRATVKRVGAHLAEGAGAAIDPRLFRLFEVTAVPAVVVVPGGVPACKSRGCASDPSPPHDRIKGNTGLDAALSIIALEGGPGRETARRHLGKLRGEHP